MNGVVPIAFVFLLLLDNGFSEVVPPPANLTVQCHNFQTVAFWNYSQPSLQPRFNVELFPYGGAPLQDESCLNITHQHCDVSKLVLGDIQEAYFLKVTAVVGSTQSEAVRSREFTYNINEVQEIHCSVDFPPVYLSVHADGTLGLQFPHPFNFYRGALRQRTGKKEATNKYKDFTYKVTVDQEQDLLICHRKNDPCEGHLPLPEGLEKACLLLEGRMNNIQITAPEKICLELRNSTAGPVPVDKDDWSVVVWPTVAAVALVVVIVLGLLVFRRKTNGSSAFPKIMASVLANPQKTRLLHVERDVTSPVLSVTLQDKAAPESPLDHCTPDPFTPEEGSRFAIGMETGSSGGFGQTQTCDAPDGSQRESEEENTARRDVESSGYDRPHIMVPLEMSPGDRVEGYKPSEA